MLTVRGKVSVAPARELRALRWSDWRGEGEGDALSVPSVRPDVECDPIWDAALLEPWGGAVGAALE